MTFFKVLIILALLFILIAPHLSARHTIHAFMLMVWTGCLVREGLLDVASMCKEAIMTGGQVDALVLEKMAYLACIYGILIWLMDCAVQYFLKRKGVL